MKHGVPARNQSFHEQNGSTIFYIFLFLVAMCLWKAVLVIGGILALFFVFLIAKTIFDQRTEVFQKEESSRRKEHEEFRKHLKSLK